MAVGATSSRSTPRSSTPSTSRSSTPQRSTPTTSNRQTPSSGVNFRSAQETPSAGGETAARGLLSAFGGTGTETETAQSSQLELDQGQLLKRGRADEGKTKQLQEMLNGGGAQLEVDGKFGPKTQEAVRAFQKKNGLDVDGVVGPKTLEALNKPSNAEQPNAEQPNAEQPNAEQPNAEQPNAEQPNAEQPNAEQPNAEQPNAEKNDFSLGDNKTLKRGAEGDLVKDLQTRLGMDNVDGEFGPQTRRAVQDFQREHGLRADGVVGSRTVDALNGKVPKNPTAGDPNADLAAGSNTRYDSIIKEAAGKYGIDPNLFKAMIRKESTFNPNAGSHKGARGLMQLMPGTSRAMGVRNPLDPRQNIFGGAKYFSQMLKAQGGNIDRALAAYNAGPGNVRKYGGIPPFRETKDYIAKVKKYYAEYQAAGGL